MAMSDADLIRVISENQFLSDTSVKKANEYAERKHISLAAALVDLDLLSSEQIAMVMSDFLKVPFVKLSTTVIPEDILRIVPEIVARKQKIIAFRKDKQGLSVAMVDTDNRLICQFIEKKTGLPVLPYITTEHELQGALALYKQNVTKVLTDLLTPYLADEEHLKKEPPIIEIVDTILSYAYQNRASDIHIEPNTEESLVRYRIDGILHDIVTIPVALHEGIVTRIKVLARLQTDEHQAAQDGKLSFDYEETGGAVDVRVSIVPITVGEKVVMRLLSEKSRQFSLTDLGLTDADLAKVQAAYAKPYGMILSSGPTGTGKTTTMYAVLKLLNKREVNIMTIEDPVEYDLEGANQIQVNVKTNLTFAAGLKSIVRQDPDIILVGEIRDEETASIAINSAMTGHLVLSTIHTNDAATSIPRLFDMHIEPFLISSSVNLIIAQRLVRRICEKCRISREVSVDDISARLSHDIVSRIFGKTKMIRMYVGKGCTICHDTGYMGRTGLFEVLLVDEKIREAIVNRSDAGVIKKLAMEAGMTTMLEDGLQKVIQGITTIEEVIRVTKE